MVPQTAAEPHLKWWVGLTAWFFVPLLLAVVIGAWTANGSAAPMDDDADLLAAYSVEAEVGPEGNALLRPVRSEAEYAELAAELRRLYSQPSERWPAPHVDEGVAFVELGPMPEPSFPTDNPYSQAKAELGEQLFFDPRLSGSRQMACASCHDPDLGWADGRTTAFGNRRKALRRNTPSILNAAHIEPLFWDGRAGSLEQQALAVIEDPDEMHAELPEVVDRLEASPGYVQQFGRAFGDARVTAERVAQAIATFERTITSRGRSDFERFLKGEPERLSDSAVRGLHLFRTVARCINCHHGPALTDNQFHDLGLSYYGRKYEDLGRYLITKDPEDVGRFKTPSLRNVTRTAPYMHNGLFDLEGVLNMYNAGMATLRRKPEQADDPLFPTKSHLLRPLGLNGRDLADLRAFLESLEELRRRIRPPELPPMTEE